jgi:hypothetical protein
VASQEYSFLVLGFWLLILSAITFHKMFLLVYVHFLFVAFISMSIRGTLKYQRVLGEVDLLLVVHG